MLNFLNEVKGKMGVEVHVYSDAFKGIIKEICSHIESCSDFEQLNMLKEKLIENREAIELGDDDFNLLLTLFPSVRNVDVNEYTSPLGFLGNVQVSPAQNGAMLKVMKRWLIRFNPSDVKDVKGFLNAFSGYPLSSKQRSIIIKTVVFNDVKYDFASLNELTGGMQGTASEEIGRLFEETAKLQEKKAPTDGQVGFLLDMYPCPSVVFEFDTAHELDDGCFKRFTQDEMKDAILKEFNFKSASDFINQNRQAFFAWKNTRATDRQIERIQQLEERMANMNKGRYVEQVAGLDGSVKGEIETNLETCTMKGYVSTPAFELQMLSREDASKFIQQLQNEMTELRKPVNSNDGQRDFNLQRHAVSVDDSVLLVDDLFTFGAIAEEEVPFEILTATEYDKDMMAKIKDFINITAEANDVDLVELMENDTFKSKSFKRIMMA